MTDVESVRRAYDTAAGEYTEFIDSVANDQHLPGAMIAAFAGTVAGRVLDAGCGPGHWTAYLRDRGLTAEGVDLSPDLVAVARRRHPDVRFFVGDIRALPIPDASLGGVLANFSVIHTPPEEVPVVLREFARVLAGDGQLLLGGFAVLDGSADHEEMPHRVSPAHRWAPDALAALVYDAGLDETARLVMQPPPGSRTPGVYLCATKSTTRLPDAEASRP